MLHPDASDYVKNIGKLLRHMADLQKLLLKIKKVSASYKEWKLIHKSLGIGIEALLITSSYLNCCEAEHRYYLQDIFKTCDIHSLHDVYERLTESIDWELTEEFQLLTIKDGYNTRLDALRGVYDSLPLELNKAAHEILEQNPLLQNVTVEYIPQLGYMIAVDTLEGNLLDPQEFSFSFADEKLYYKCSLARRMDTEIGDIKNQIADFQKSNLSTRVACIYAY